MSSSGAITVASDDAIIGLIRAARNRLVVLAPALSQRVGEVLCQRWQELGPERVSVILDVDAEVYRLGYGQVEALMMLEKVAANLGTMLQRQPGIRIGLLVSDSTTLVYSPTPLLVEAGPAPAHPTQTAKPNAILLDHTPPAITNDLGCGDQGVRAQTVGLDKAERREIESVKEDLTRNPPQKFDIARKVRVFNAAFEFVEFELLGTQIDRKTIEIPSDLMGLARDEQTRRLLRANFRLVDEFDELSGHRLKRAKNWIVKNYLAVLPGYGTVVIRTVRPDFEKKVQQLQRCVDRFKRIVQKRLEAAMQRNRERLAEALLPSVVQNPPQHWRKYGALDQKAVRQLLGQELAVLSGSAEDLIEHMKIKLVFKGVTYDSLCDPEFVQAVRKAIPGLEAIVDEFDAAKAEEKDDDDSDTLFPVKR